MNPKAEPWNRALRRHLSPNLSSLVSHLPINAVFRMSLLERAGIGFWSGIQRAVTVRWGS